MDSSEVGLRSPPAATRGQAAVYGLAAIAAGVPMARRLLAEEGRMQLAFDRGTLLLRGGTSEELNEDVRTLPGVLWDPRVLEYRAPAWCYPEIIEAIRERGLTCEDQVANNWKETTVVRWNAPPLRPYQQAAVLAWETTGWRGTLVMPTGSGKTRTAISAIAALGLPTLCLVPTRVLLHQWRAELGQACRAPVGILGDGSRHLDVITVATFESAYRHMSRLGDRFRLLVVDEVHHFGSPCRAEALEMSVAPHRLGLTATPPGATTGAARGARRVRDLRRRSRRALASRLRSSSLAAGAHTRGATGVLAGD